MHSSICKWHLGWMIFFKYQVYILVLNNFPHFEYHIEHFFRKLAIVSHRYWGTVFVCILFIVVNLAFFLLSYNGSQPVSKYKDSFYAKIGEPVTILAALVALVLSLIYQYPKLNNHPKPQKHILVMALQNWHIFLMICFYTKLIWVSWSIPILYKHDLQCYQCT